MSPLMIALFVLGFGLLIGGAELLVRGASGIARGFGISPLVVGLTVVAFGTGAPELAVAIRASLVGASDLAIGNVVGSNVFNILVVLGLSAMVVPLAVAQQIVRLDVPVMIGVSGLLMLIVLDHSLGRFDGFVLLACMTLYTWMLIRQGRRESAAAREAYEDQAGGAAGTRTTLLQVGLMIAGLVLLLVGARWLVDGASTIAAAFGVSSLVIGLTIVAGGTSLPEVATSVVAGLRGERDIAVGNAIGSNIFNICAVLGAAGLLTPGGVIVAPAAVNFDIPFMLAVAIACLPIFFRDLRLERWEGVVFVLYYVAYTTYLILRAAEHDALPEFSFALQTFVFPITAITIVLLALRGWRRRRRAARAEG